MAAIKKQRRQTRSSKSTKKAVQEVTVKICTTKDGPHCLVEFKRQSTLSDVHQKLLSSTDIMQKVNLEHATSNGIGICYYSDFDFEHVVPFDILLADLPSTNKVTTIVARAMNLFSYTFRGVERQYCVECEHTTENVLNLKQFVAWTHSFENIAAESLMVLDANGNILRNTDDLAQNMKVIAVRTYTYSFNGCVLPYHVPESDTHRVSDLKDHISSVNNFPRELLIVSSDGMCMEDSDDLVLHMDIGTTEDMLQQMLRSIECATREN